MQQELSPARTPNTASECLHLIANSLMDALACLGGKQSGTCAKTRARSRLASPSAYADLLHQHRSGSRLTRLRPSRDSRLADKIMDGQAAFGTAHRRGGIQPFLWFPQPIMPGKVVRSAPPPRRAGHHARPGFASA